MPRELHNMFFKLPLTSESASGRRKYDKSRTCVKCKTNVGNIVIRHAVYCR